MKNTTKAAHRFISYWNGWDITDKKLAISLESYAKDRMKETVIFNEIFDRLKYVVRTEALEEAAKIAENTGNECINCLDSVARRIRALKDESNA